MEPLPKHSRDSAAFIARLREAADDSGVVTFAEFTRTALYDPEVGYYTSRRERVGRGGETDFYTSSSMDAVFGRLVATAAANLLGPDAGKHTFVEIGAEPGRSLLEGVSHGFANVRTLRLGDALGLPDRAVVFSNELFDALPFHRVRWRNGGWREIGVSMNGDSLAYVELPQFSEPVFGIADQFPAAASEGYILDLPIAASELAATLAAGRWSGAFIAFDYGRSWDYLCHATPAGTARAYLRHQQSNDLLSHPGAQDLTCHVCWDWLEAALAGNGFANVRLQSQEAFFIKHAGAAIGQIITETADPLARPRAQLKELLHPGLLGQKLEVLFGTRLGSV